MFEQEVEMEEREASAIPLLLIVTLILAIVGMAGYYLWQNHQVLTSQEATTVVSAALDAQGPAMIHFDVGNVRTSVAVKPHDPNYRLLEKAGWLKLGKDQGRAIPVTLTPKGETQIQAIAGVKKAKEADGTQSYAVPLAARRLVEVSAVTMIDPKRATVEFTWKWEPNELGQIFDAAGPLVKSFNTWERATLIEKYDAGFYHGNPAKAALTLVKTNRGWQVAVD
jgi:hypothetical protein